MAKKQSQGEAPNLSMSIQYSKRLTDWRLWENKAEELLKAAKLLEPQVKKYWSIVDTNFKEGRYSDPQKLLYTPPFNPQSTHFMLVAYALENLLKAIIIRNRQNSLRNRLFKRLPGVFTTHDLRGLAEEANVPTSVAEEDLLHRLSLQSIWSSRYPIPIQVSAMKNVETYSDGNSYLTAIYPDDTERIKNMLKRVEALL
ncbi:hypothetical protein ACFLVW_02615 [Chloroflexota bacterium]